MNTSIQDTGSIRSAEMTSTKIATQMIIGMGCTNSSASFTLRKFGASQQEACQRQRHCDTWTVRNPGCVQKCRTWYRA
eukprot:8997253-Pyramimonas_sp.AAC.1